MKEGLSTYRHVQYVSNKLTYVYQLHRRCIILNYMQTRIRHSSIGKILFFFLYSFVSVVSC